MCVWVSCWICDVSAFESHLTDERGKGKRQQINFNLHTDSRLFDWMVNFVVAIWWHDTVSHLNERDARSEFSVYIQYARKTRLFCFYPCLKLFWLPFGGNLMWKWLICACVRVYACESRVERVFACTNHRKKIAQSADHLLEIVFSRRNISPS